jgi:hypothetical protein
MSRLVRPTSVIRQSIRVTPGLVDPDAGESPAGNVFFEPRWDPYDRVVVFELPPANRWIPQTLYSVTVLPADPASVAGLRALDGTAIEEPVSFGFTPGDSVSDPEHDVDDRWPEVGFCTGAPAYGIAAPRDVLRDSCATAGCHVPLPGSAPAMGLDLSTPDGIRATAVRVTARQTMHSPQVGPSAVNPSTFGDSMPRIDPGNPGNSYLMYKLLIHEGNYPRTTQSDDLARPWLGDLPAEAGAPVDEIERMRSTFVVGGPMPVTGALMPEQMRGVMTWIAYGAEVTDCPSVR